MVFRKTPLLLCAAIVLVLLPSIIEGSSNNKKAESRSDCDHILPLMMMLGAAPTALPSSWLLGMLSLGVIVFLGSGNFSNWERSFCDDESEEREETEGKEFISESLAISH